MSSPPAQNGDPQRAIVNPRAELIEQLTLTEADAAIQAIFRDAVRIISALPRVEFRDEIVIFERVAGLVADLYYPPPQAGPNDSVLIFHISRGLCTSPSCNSVHPLRIDASGDADLDQHEAMALAIGVLEGLPPDERTKASNTVYLALSLHEPSKAIAVPMSGVTVHVATHAPAATRPQ